PLELPWKRHLHHRHDLLRLLPRLPVDELPLPQLFLVAVAVPAIPPRLVLHHPRDGRDELGDNSRGMEGPIPATAEEQLVAGEGEVDDPPVAHLSLSHVHRYRQRVQEGPHHGGGERCEYRTGAVDQHSERGRHRVVPYRALSPTVIVVVVAAGVPPDEREEKPQSLRAVGVEVLPPELRGHTQAVRAGLPSRRRRRVVPAGPLQEGRQEGRLENRVPPPLPAVLKDVDRHAEPEGAVRRRHGGAGGGVQELQDERPHDRLEGRQEGFLSALFFF
ncbi:unnamed protein product, partial [Ectocarpus sp. 13 AM-2016]